jgi:hypothetical protein
MGVLSRALTPSLLAGVCLAAVAAQPAVAAKAPKIRVLSNRADLVSAGDALVAVKPPAGVSPSRLRVRLRGEDGGRRLGAPPKSKPVRRKR